MVQGRFFRIIMVQPRARTGNHAMVLRIALIDCSGAAPTDRASHSAEMVRSTTCNNQHRLWFSCQELVSPAAGAEAAPQARPGRRRGLVSRCRWSKARTTTRSCRYPVAEYRLLYSYWYCHIMPTLRTKIRPTQPAGARPAERVAHSGSRPPPLHSASL